MRNTLLDNFWHFSFVLVILVLYHRKSYFTEKGNRKFRKKIREIQKLAESKGVGFETIIKDSSEISDIFYSDVYQVVILD